MADPNPAGRGEPGGAPQRWLLFVHQLPSQPSNLRVTTWRRLQQLGAIALKQAVYALPDTPDAREDFEWLKAEVKAAGGDASVFAAAHADAWTDDQLIAEFRRTRRDMYEALARDVEKALKRTGRRKTARVPRGPGPGRMLALFQQRLADTERIDFFGGGGRDRALTLVRRLEEHAAASGRTPARPASTGSTRTIVGQNRLWITRPRPGVDRMASAWLIRRFIDPRARFGFAADRDRVPDQAIPFDMFDVEYSHRNGGCTFETLCAAFGLDDPALPRIAAIVHDLDLKDGRFGAPECGTVGAMIEGLQLAHADDDALLSQGMTLFESLYRAFERAERSRHGTKGT
jgi:hypothetical protein